MRDSRSGARCARLLDHALCSLVHEEARLRLHFGRVLALFGCKHALTKLGFVRMSNYARERLGISGSEAEVTHRVANRLDGLPLLREAFLAGRLSWTKVRILVAVANTENEARWLDV